MKRTGVIALVMSIVLASAANAQIFDKIKRGATKTLKKKVLGGEKEADKPAGKAEPAAKSGAHPSAKKGGDRKYPPGLSYSSVLNGVKLLSKKAQFRLHHIQATFLPGDNPAGYTILRTADGKEICRFNWKSQKLKEPYRLLDFWEVTDLRSGKKVPGGLALSQPGDYVLDFYLPDEHFYTFPFSISKLSGADPFAGGDFLFLDGDWSKWGYLYYRDADPTKSLQWKVWLRNKEAKPNADVKIRIEVKRDGDGALVCTNRKNMTFGLRPEWVRAEFDLIFPMEGTSGGRYFKAKDLLVTDGAYTLTMKIDDKPYGTWKFAVAAGKLNYTGRTERGKADPLTFIEGGRDAWWYCKQ